MRKIKISINNSNAKPPIFGKKKRLLKNKLQIGDQIKLKNL